MPYPTVSCEPRDNSDEPGESLVDGSPKINATAKHWNRPIDSAAICNKLQSMYGCQARMAVRMIAVSYVIMRIAMMLTPPTEPVNLKEVHMDGDNRELVAGPRVLTQATSWRLLPNWRTNASSSHVSAL